MIQQAFVGYVYGDSTCGQRALYPVGMTGIPVSTSTTTARPARRRCSWRARRCNRRGRLRAGARLRADAAGRHQGGLRPTGPTPFEEFDQATDALVGHPEIPLALRYFGGAGKAHMDKYGTKLETFAPSAPRPAAMPSTTRWRCSARKSAPRT
jgi:sterol carrier protein 2